MVCHTPLKCPCRTTQDSWKLGKFTIPAPGQMNSGLRQMVCRTPLKCPCRTTQESVNSVWEWVYSLLPDGYGPDENKNRSDRCIFGENSAFRQECGCGWMPVVFGSADSIACLEQPRDPWKCKVNEFFNSGFRVDEIRLPVVVLLSVIEILTPNYPRMRENWKN